jgi:type IV pilus assembly protein PilM
MIRNRFFPKPKFLLSPSFGLDISDESIKFIELVEGKNGFRVNRYGKKMIPKGVIEAGIIKDPERMKKILISLKKEEGLKSVRVSLPDEEVYILNLQLNKLNLKDIRKGIELSLEKYMSIPVQDVSFDYELLSADTQGVKLQATVIQKDIIQEYLSTFKDSNISVKSFESDAQAITRSVVKKGDLDTSMIVNFAKKYTGISIVSGGIVISTSTIDVGGDMLTNMIKEKFKISFEDAEKMKKEYGLRKDRENTGIFTILLDGVSILYDEIQRHLLYWHTHKDEEDRKSPVIEKLIFCGGGSNLKGLSEYFSINLKTKVEIANVWVNILDTEKYVPEINFEESLGFASALGLALGDFEHE